MLPDITVHAERCLQRRLTRFQCSLCVDSCHSNNVTLKEGEIHIDADSCTKCGKCITACPAEVFVIEDDEHYRVLEQLEPSVQMVISCRRQIYDSPCVLHVPCLGALPFEFFLFLAIRQENDIVINMAECAQCTNSHVTDHVKAIVSRIEQLPLPRPLAKFISVRDSDELPVHESGNRRYFLADMGDKILSFMRNRFEKQASTSIPSRTHRRSLSGKSRILQKAIALLDRESRKVVSATCLPLLTIQRSCSLCPRCAGICPTGALERVSTNGNKQLIFNSEKCSSCGLCVAFCKENSLQLSARGEPWIL
ncbi:4Fe-4S dicluster domain-containing protein [Desulfopila aestuarii]